MRHASSRKNSRKDFFVLKKSEQDTRITLATPATATAAVIAEKPRLTGLRVNLGIAEIAYQGKGQFLYFYKRRGTLKSGALTIDRKALIWLGLAVVCVSVSASLTLWKKRQNAVKMAFAETKTGVGGVGRLESGKVITDAADITGEVAQFEEDEKIKNQLMGVIEERSAESKQAMQEANKVQKLKYKVKPGDTLQSIAKKYKVKPESISGSSRLGEFQDVSVGQTLSIPTRDGFYYIVKKNERLANILQAHKVTLDKFMTENEHVNVDLLDVGEEIFLPGAKPIMRAEGWLIPVSSRVVTSGYGWRSWPRAAFHKGLDLKAFYVPVRAAKSGTVTYSGWLGGYGNAIIVQHDDTYKTLYAHLSRRHVAVGQRVRRGQVLGRTGDTGYSFGPHLHFEISKNGSNVNPIKFLKGLRGRSKKR
ncbi:MAG: peptidoglycan DD-metalloendopeptidase family protein [Leptospiraceae bacterium]|nr:peptidoglycan DD-metalloendopeptidase family protein [Leptospiraceae bacterium]